MSLDGAAGPVIGVVRLYHSSYRSLLIYIGHLTSNLKVGASGLQKPPASIVIDRLYMEAGSTIIGGFNMSFNKRHHPFWLERESDYPSLLKWVSLQPVIFYDVDSRRAWLVDGASALLQLVRISLSLDESDPESPYDWVFKASKLKDKWDPYPSRSAAIKTLKNWDNLSLNLYITDRAVRQGKMVTEYATWRTRVEKILHSLEILIDRQVKLASEDGIKIPQTLNPHKTITGFDILDVISPIGPIHPRIQHLKSWGPGWRELTSSVGITTIFGRGFGELIRPEYQDVCRNWAFMPAGSDYLAASVSTLKMLREHHLTRIWPGLGVNELTDKITWSCLSEPFKKCGCVGNNAQVRSHLNPVQFLVPQNSRAWNIRSSVFPCNMNPVDITQLDEQGAIIFGNLSLTRVENENDDRGVEQELQSLEMSSATESQAMPTPGSASNLSISALGSTVVSSVSIQGIASTDLTSNRTGNCPRVHSEMEEALNQEDNGNRKRKRRFLLRLREWI